MYNVCIYPLLNCLAPWCMWVCACETVCVCVCVKACVDITISLLGISQQDSHAAKGSWEWQGVFTKNLTWPSLTCVPNRKR